MANSTRNHPVPVQDYAAVFEKHFECEPGSYVMKPAWEDGPLLVQYEDAVYRVDNYLDILDLSREALTSEATSTLLPLELWIDVAKGVHAVPEFVERMTEKLATKDQFEALNLALSISKFAGKGPLAFWNTLHTLDPEELFSIAVLTAGEVYDLEIMVEELATLVTDDGEEYLNQLEEGYFGTEPLKDDDADNDWFYIYTVDPAAWEL